MERYWLGIDRLAVAWAQREGLAVADLQVAAWAGPGDVVVDPADPVLAYDDDSVGVLRATDVLQRIPDRGRFFAECFRVLAPGGLLMTATPSTDGRGAFQDPTHVSYWNANRLLVPHPGGAAGADLPVVPGDEVPGQRSADLVPDRL
ncbi:methyltransferase domain-containing protein [Nocardioides convexus]|uniref:methyltransferase domain-containing protein n=1 Tax=Nocardioides convexus TaxID=2712224 RepID=UPI002418ABE0|nr:methyltransferase domain-containing protein [Nocardioides convexus]